jgi:hypothetical protein
MKFKWKAILTIVVITGWFKLWLIYMTIKLSSSFDNLHFMIAFKRYYKVSKNIFRAEVDIAFNLNTGNPSILNNLISFLDELYMYYKQASR